MQLLLLTLLVFAHISLSHAGLVRPSFERRNTELVDRNFSYIRHLFAEYDRQRGRVSSDSESDEELAVNDEAVTENDGNSNENNEDNVIMVEIEEDEESDGESIVDTELQSDDNENVNNDDEDVNNDDEIDDDDNENFNNDDENDDDDFNPNDPDSIDRFIRNVQSFVNQSMKERLKLRERSFPFGNLN